MGRVFLNAVELVNIDADFIEERLKQLLVLSGNCYRDIMRKKQRNANHLI
jgi:hypothetical protein